MTRPQPSSIEEWMRETERRLQRLERRPLSGTAVRSAAEPVLVEDAAPALRAEERDDVEESRGVDGNH